MEVSGQLSQPKPKSEEVEAKIRSDEAKDKGKNVALNKTPNSTKKYARPNAATKKFQLRTQSDGSQELSLVCRIPLKKLPIALANRLKNCSTGTKVVAGMSGSHSADSTDSGKETSSENEESEADRISASNRFRLCACQWKRSADQVSQCGDIINSARLYLESAMYFIMSGNTLRDSPRSGSAMEAMAMSIFEGTLNIFDTVETNYWRSTQPKPNSNIEHLMKAFSYKCQAVLYTHIYKQKCTLLSAVITAGNELQRFNEEFEQFQSKKVTEPPGFPLKASKYYLHTMNLFNSHKRWKQADDLIEEHHLEYFFSDVERTSGELVLNSKLELLVRFMKEGLTKLKDRIELEEALRNLQLEHCPSNVESGKH